MKRLTISAALAALESADDKTFASLFSHGSMRVEIYKPHKVDAQQPHTQDELYVIASGAGFFVNNGVRQPVEVGEVLFVAAGIPHHFEDFTDDFSTWVIFYGKEGGEAGD